MKLLEVILAMALITGFCAAVLPLLRSSSLACRQTAEQAIARQYLADLGEYMAGLTLPELQGLDVLEPRSFLHWRTSGLPASVREPYLQALAPMAGHVSCELARGPRLWRVTFAVHTASGSIRSTRYFRPASAVARLEE